jgi:hypothetical protein
MVGASPMPEVEEDFEISTFEGSKLIDMETNILRKNCKSEDSFPKGNNFEKLSRSTNDRLED